MTPVTFGTVVVALSETACIATIIATATAANTKDTFNMTALLVDTPPGIVRGLKRRRKFLGSPTSNSSELQHPSKEPVGNAFDEIRVELKVEKPRGCSCAALQASMNKLGVSGCREQFGPLVEQLRANFKEVDWASVFRAIPMAVLTGLAFKVNPIDPLPGMLREAIRRIERRRSVLPSDASPASVPPFTGPTVRHLIYHLYPHRTAPWEWNVEQLLQRIHLFNGRKLIGAVFDQNTVSEQEVFDKFAGSGCEIIVKPNDQRLREHTTFETLLSKVESVAPNEVVFRAHSKHGTLGNAKARGPVWEESRVKRWIELMYEQLLDNYPACEVALNDHAVAGVLRRHSKLGQTGAKWYFAGSFYWLRSAAVFSHDWRSAIFNGFLCAEAFPARLCRVEESACLLGDNVADPYQAWCWRDLEPELVAARNGRGDNHAQLQPVSG